MTVKKTAKFLYMSLNVAAGAKHLKRSKNQHYRRLRTFLYNETELVYNIDKAPSIRMVGAFSLIRQKKSSKIFTKNFFDALRSGGPHLI